MKNNVFKFCSYLKNIILSVFNFILILLTIIVIKWADEINIILVILLILMILLYSIILYHSWRNKIIINDNKIIYVGFKKHIILKNEITSIDDDGVRIKIVDKNKTYIIPGYIMDYSFNIKKGIEKNKKLIDILKKSLEE